MTTSKEQEKWRRLANQIMNAYPEHLPFQDRRKIVIHFSAHRTCQNCGAGISKPCTSLNRSPSKKGRENRWPHDVRIDWEMMVTSLHRRGFSIRGQKI